MKSSESMVSCNSTVTPPNSSSLAAISTLLRGGSQLAFCNADIHVVLCPFLVGAAIIEPLMTNQKRLIRGKVYKQNIEASKCQSDEHSRELQKQKTWHMAGVHCWIEMFCI